MTYRFALVLLAYFGLAGCSSFLSYDAVVDKLASQYSSEVDLAKKYLAMAQAHNVSIIEDNIDPKIKTPQTHDILEKLADTFPVGKPISFKIIGLNHNDLFSSGQATIETTSFVFEYEFPGRWLQAAIVLRKIGDKTTITSMSVTPLRDSLENVNRFRLAGKSLMHYFFLTMTITVPLFILAALITCIRTPKIRLKWLWILFILMGFPTFYINWVDGTIYSNLLSAQLFGASIPSAIPYNPVILAVSIPVGAILFFLWRKSWLGSG